MKTLIKLTSQGNPVLINFNNVVEVSPAQGGQLSRVNFVGGNYKIVEESMESIMQIVEEVNSVVNKKLIGQFKPQVLMSRSNKPSNLVIHNLKDNKGHINKDLLVVMRETITHSIHIIKTTINMKEIITTLVDAYKEDKREFLTSVGFGIVWVLLTWFLLWFAGTFAYDM